MMRRSFLALPALLASCASPETAYFALAVRSGPVVRGGPKVVEIRRIGLPGYLDRPEIVRSNADYRLRIPSSERWGEPLGDMIGRVLAEDLNSRLPGSAVYTALGAISSVPDAVVEIDLQRFDAGAANEVVLLAQVAVASESNRNRTPAQTIRLAAQAAGPSAADLVAAMSTVLGQLADRVAAMLRTAAASGAAPAKPRTARRRQRK